MLTVHGPVILDLNTQRDLLLPDGAYPMENAAKLLDPLKRLFAWAQRQQVPVVSTRLNSVMAPQRGSHKLVCTPGTPGYAKAPGTQLRRRLELPLDCGTSLPVDGFKTSQQYVFDLVSLNPFECPRLDRLLSESQVGVWLICGGPLEWSVRTSVLGLLQRRHKVAVVSDAMGMWDPYEGDMALRQIESKNIDWVKVEDAPEKYAPKPVRRPVAPAAGVVRKDRKPLFPVPGPTKAPAKAPAKAKLAKREFRLT